MQISDFRVVFAQLGMPVQIDCRNRGRAGTDVGFERRVFGTTDARPFGGIHQFDDHLQVSRDWLTRHGTVCCRQPDDVEGRVEHCNDDCCRTLIPESGLMMSIWDTGPSQAEFESQFQSLRNEPFGSERPPPHRP